jgi:hypothetical protein
MYKLDVCKAVAIHNEPFAAADSRCSTAIRRVPPLRAVAYLYILVCVCMLLHTAAAVM